jgi:hypothetical protein
MTRLRGVEVANFRGFGEERRIDLDADAIIITGPNGVGKTSLIDAITWGLTGSIARLEQRRERKNDDLLSNRYRPGAVPSVRLDLALDDGVELQVSREAHKEGSSVTLRRNGSLVSGAASSLADALGFPDEGALKYAVETWGVLHQDSMRAVLEARPEEFQRRLREILGLSPLDDFEAWIKGECKSVAENVAAARGRMQQAQSVAVAAKEALSRARATLAEAAQMASAKESLAVTAREVAPRINLRLPETIDALAVASLLQEVRRLELEIPQRWALLATTNGVLQESEARIAELNVEDLRAKTADARERYEAAQKRYEEAVHANQVLQDRLDGLAALAVAALPHLADECPVCQQSIDAETVRLHLQSLIESTGELDAYRELEGQEQIARETAQEAEIALGEASRREQVAEASVRQVAQLRSEREALTNWFAALASDDAQIPVRMPSLEEEAITQMTLDVRRVQSGLLQWQQELANESVRVEEPRLRAVADEAEAQELFHRGEVERLAARQLSLEGLAKASTEAIVDITRQWLVELNPLFGAVYNRMAAHPTFTQLGLEHDVYYGKGRTMPRVYDPLIDIGDNPQIVCSEGQLNIVALSYFIAFGLSAGNRALPFMIMDDPLQFMDEINVLGFADLCRHLRARRQIVVTTHDRRFARLLERKFRPRREAETTLEIDFASWERSGPRIEVERRGASETSDVLNSAVA